MRKPIHRTVIAIHYNIFAATRRCHFYGYTMLYNPTTVRSPPKRRVHWCTMYACPSLSQPGMRERRAPLLKKKAAPHYWPGPTGEKENEATILKHGSPRNQIGHRVKNHIESLKGNARQAPESKEARLLDLIASNKNASPGQKEKHVPVQNCLFSIINCKHCNRKAPPLPKYESPVQTTIVDAKAFKFDLLYENKASQDDRMQKGQQPQHCPLKINIRNAPSTYFALKEAFATTDAVLDPSIIGVIDGRICLAIAHLRHGYEREIVVGSGPVDIEAIRRIVAALESDARLSRLDL